MLAGLCWPRAGSSEEQSNQPRATGPWTFPPPLFLPCPHWTSSAGEKTGAVMGGCTEDPQVGEAEGVSGEAGGRCPARPRDGCVFKGEGDVSITSRRDVWL